MSFESISRVPSKLFKDEAGGGSNWSPPTVDDSVLKDVVQKLETLSQYSTSGKSEKQREAIKLITKAEMKSYFSDYLHERNLFVVVSHQQPHTPEDASPSSSAEATTTEAEKLTLEQTIVIEDDNRETLVQRLSDFSVKLHITLEHDEAGIQIGLQVGEQLIEWTPESVIKPHKNIPLETIFSIDLSHCLMKTLTQRESQNSEVDDRVLKLTRARDCLIEHVVKLIITFNRYYYYRNGFHDSQKFISNILGALMIDTLPNLSCALSKYVTDLRNGDDILPAQDHMELDNYVAEHIEGMSTGMVEYMALLYYQHHLDSRAKADDAGSETWKCPENQCQLTTLLLKLNK